MDEEDLKYIIDHCVFCNDTVLVESPQLYVLCLRCEEIGNTSGYPLWVSYNGEVWKRKDDKFISEWVKVENESLDEETLALLDESMSEVINRGSFAKYVED